MKTKIAILLAMVLLLALLPVMADQPKGAKDIPLYGGKRGNVPFPHHAHQERLNDCTICHDLFPQEAGVIEKLKKEKKLKSKKVMNSRCIKCHRESKRAGKKSGPVKCKGCHIRE